MRKQVEAWQQSELTDVTAKVVIYEAFVEGRLEAPKHLARTVHDLYFEPKYEEFRPRTIWSLSNAFTSAFKELEPIPQFRATAKLGEFLETGSRSRFSDSWRYRPDRRFFIAPFVWQALRGGIRFPDPTAFPEARFWTLPSCGQLAVVNECSGWRLLALGANVQSYLAIPHLPVFAAIVSAPRLYSSRGRGPHSSGSAEARNRSKL